MVSREWKNGSNSSYNCTPFLHSLLTKPKVSIRAPGCASLQGRRSCRDSPCPFPSCHPRPPKGAQAEGWDLRDSLRGLGSTQSIHVVFEVVACRKQSRRGEERPCLRLLTILPTKDPMSGMKYLSLQCTGCISHFEDFKLAWSLC